MGTVPLHGHNIVGSWCETIKEGYFFTHLFIYDGEKKTSRVVELLQENKIFSDPHLPWCNEKRSATSLENLFIGDYVARDFEVCDGGQVDLRIYPNPSIRNDLAFVLPLEGTDGLLYKNYRPKLWRRNLLKDIKTVKFGKRRRKLTQRDILGHGEVVDTIRHQNLFYNLFQKS
jgi:hypothetical protein